ncbi:hypothetical protein G6F35_015468 [Rhizopus arrhizus]|nr:hypothetical protein G6F35_015468 [Rhizopus arrhizus]
MPEAPPSPPPAAPVWKPSWCSCSWPAPARSPSPGVRFRGQHVLRGAVVAVALTYAVAAVERLVDVGLGLRNQPLHGPVEVPGIVVGQLVVLGDDLRSSRFLGTGPVKACNLGIDGLGSSLLGCGALLRHRSQVTRGLWIQRATLIDGLGQRRQASHRSRRAVQRVGERRKTEVFDQRATGQAEPKNVAQAR